MDELAPSYSAQIFNDFIAQQLFRVVEILLQRCRNRQRVGPAQRTVLRGGGRAERRPGALGPRADRGGPARSPRYGRCSTGRAARGRCGRPSPPRSASRRSTRAVASTSPNTGIGRSTSSSSRPTRWTSIRSSWSSMVRNYLRVGRTIPEMEAREREIRRSAERKAAAAMKGSLPRQLLFAFALRQARETRQAAGEHAPRPQSLLRPGQTGLPGARRRVPRRGNHRDPRDIFFLTYQEVFAITRGTFIDGDPRRLVAERKRDHERWREVAPGSRIVTSGIAMAHAHEPDFAEFGDADVLVGVGCAPGQVRAPALVLTEPSADVTRRRRDPGGRHHRSRLGVPDGRRVRAWSAKRAASFRIPPSSVASSASRRWSGSRA